MGHSNKGEIHTARIGNCCVGVIRAPRLNDQPMFGKEEFSGAAGMVGWFWVWRNVSDEFYRAFMKEFCPDDSPDS